MTKIQPRATGIILVTSLQLVAWIAGTIIYNLLPGFEAAATTVLVNLVFIVLSAINMVLIVMHLLKVRRHHQKPDMVALGLVAVLAIAVLASLLLAS